MANKYELMVIFSPVLGEEGIASVSEAITAKIAAAGTVDNTQALGMKRLAYEINDQKEGFYLQVNFTADADLPKEIERVLKITEGVLRFLIIRIEE
ncbi:MAG TPA: 30S ribosomal protein S6 [Bacillota bacterium]|nr:30S ribosomal protein S6 [Bacillota bacterium]HPE38969.1 30S ribosomal protein S6 [Bacillota bacterium]